MECINARVSFSQWRLRAFRQLLVTSQPLTTQVVKRSISTSQQILQSNEAASKEQTDTSRLDSVPPSQRLPQSPLIAYSRPRAEKNRKRRPTSEETSELSKNPWASALASPIRMCSITGARLPSDLLGTWGLVRQPETDMLCMMPVGLMQDSLQSSESQGPSSNKPAPANEDLSQSPEAGLQDKAMDEAFAGEFLPAARNKHTGRQLVLRITELLPLIRCITEPLSKKSAKKPPVARLLPFRWKHPQGPVTTSEEKKLLWLGNTPEILLQGMRRDVCKKLGAALAKYKRVGTPNGVWKALDLPEYSDAGLADGLGQLEMFDRIQSGGVLLLGSDSPVGGSQANISLDSVTLSQTGSNVPVFDLSALLSVSDLHALREAHEQFKHSALFFRPDDKMGIDAMVSLWKIKRLLGDTDLPGQ